jgi:glutathione S-transferase
MENPMSDKPLLIIGNKNYSSWSLRPWLLLRHHRIAFDEQRLLLDTPEFARTIADWSPNRAVPALRHAGITIWDSLAICEYANEIFLDRDGWPADAQARAVARSVSAEMHSGFVALRKALPMNCRRRTHGSPLGADVLANIARIGAIWRDCRARFAAAGPFLFGDFSIADAMYAPVASRFVSYGVDMDASMQAYVDTLFALPALQEWLRAAAAETETLAATDEVA